MVLRAIFGRGDDDEQRREPAPAAEPAAANEPFATQMRSRLNDVCWLGRGAGATLPIRALPLLGEIEDVIAPLLTHLEAHPPNAEEEFAVEAMLTDYVPSTLRAYIGMAPQLQQAAGADGRTPGDELVEQLALLGQGARDLAAAIYSHDAQELATQGRFLSAKFQQTDLAL